MPDLTLPLGLTLSLSPGEGHLWLNLDALRGTHAFIQGSTGAGKSHLTRWLCEQLFGKMQQLIFDLEGEYVTLTERFDYALFSGTTQIRPDPDSAPLLVRRLLEIGTSAIFDLSELPTAEQQRFVAAAAGELVRAPQGVPRSVLVVMDEVQRLAPQAGQGEAASTQAIRDLANRGRKRGISLLLATQRHSSVDAGLRGVMGNTIVGGTPPGLDMESAGKKLGFNTQQQRRLASLRHEFFFLGPAFGDPEGERQVRLAKSGAVQTHHLDAGEARTYTPPPASEAVAALYAQLGDIPAQAEAEAQAEAGRRKPQDLEALQVKNRMQAIRIAEMEAEIIRLQGLPAEAVRLHAATSPQAGKTPAAPAKVPAAAPEFIPGPFDAGLPSSLAVVPSQSVPVNDKPDLVNDKPDAVNEKPRNKKPGVVNVNLRRLELLLSEFRPFALTLPQLGALTHMDLSGRSGQNAVRALRREGLATWAGERLAATEKGCRTSVRPMDAETYRRRWEQVLGATPSRLLRALGDAAENGHPAITWAEWRDWAAYSSSGSIQVARASLVELGFAVLDGKRYHLGDWPREEDAAADPTPYLRLDSA